MNNNKSIEQIDAAFLLFEKHFNQFWDRIPMGAVLDTHSVTEFSVNEQSDFAAAHKFLETAIERHRYKNLKKSFEYYIENKRHPGFQPIESDEIIIVAIATRFFIDPCARIVFAINPDRGSWSGMRDPKELVVFEMSERHPEGFITSLKPREYFDYIL